VTPRDCQSQTVDKINTYSDRRGSQRALPNPHCVHSQPIHLRYTLILGGVGGCAKTNLHFRKMSDLQPITPAQKDDESIESPQEAPEPAPITDQEVGEYREQDRFLPVACTILTNRFPSHYSFFVSHHLLSPTHCFLIDS
jgi:hypothetical protein